MAPKALSGAPAPLSKLVPAAPFVPLEPFVPFVPFVPAGPVAPTTEMPLDGHTPLALGPITVRSVMFK